MALELGLQVTSEHPTTFADIDLIRELGAEWIAMPCDMHHHASAGSMGDPTAGFNFNLWNGQNLRNNVIYAKAANSHGPALKVLIGFMSSPEWMPNVGAGILGKKIPQDASERAAWSELAVFVLQELGPAVDAFQIWNEPNHGPFNRAPRMATIRPFMRSVILAMRAEDPDVVLLPGAPASAPSWDTEWVARWDSDPRLPGGGSGTTSSDPAQQSISTGTYLDGLYGPPGVPEDNSGINAGNTPGTAWVNGLAVHAHTGFRDPYDIAVNKGNNLMGSFVDIPDRGTTPYNYYDDILQVREPGTTKRIWQTEAGTNVGAAGFTEAMGQNYLFMTLFYWNEREAEGKAGPYFYFQLREYYVYGASSNPEHYHGLYRLNPDGTYSAKAQMTSWLYFSQGAIDPPDPDPPDTAMTIAPREWPTAVELRAEGVTLNDAQSPHFDGGHPEYDDLVNDYLDLFIEAINQHALLINQATGLNNAILGGGVDADRNPAPSEVPLTLYLSTDIANGRLWFSSGFEWRVIADNVFATGGIQVLSPVSGVVQISGTEGGMCLIGVDEDCGIEPPITSVTTGTPYYNQELVLIIVQDATGGHGVLWDALFDDPPIVDTNAAARTTAVFRWTGFSWANIAGGSSSSVGQFQVVTPTANAIEVDTGFGLRVWAIIDEDCGIEPPLNAMAGDILEFVFEQDSVGRHGVLFNSIFEEPPLIGTDPTERTSARFMYLGDFGGQDWANVGDRGRPSLSHPALTATLLPDFTDGRTGWNGAPWSQDDTTLGAGYGSSEQYHIWWRRGHPFDINIDNTAVIARRSLPNGTWDEFWPMTSTAWFNEMGDSEYPANTNVTNGLGEILHTAGHQGSPDDHNTWACAVTEDGFFWVCGNEHSDPLHFIRSAIPVDEWEHGTDPGWVASGLIAARGGGGVRPSQAALQAAQEWEVTYPCFVRLATGTQLLFYRDGYSGSSAGWCCDRYTPSGTPGVAGTWARIGGTHFLTSVDNNYGAGSTSFYPQRIVAHPILDRVAIFGTWRQGGVANNLHLSFAWLVNLDGTPAALDANGTIRALPLSVSPGSPAGGQGMERVLTTDPFEMMNDGGADIDHLTRPHTVIYKPDGIPTAYGTQTMQLAHVYWDGTAWQSPLVTNVPNRMELFATNSLAFSAGVESAGQITLSGIAPGHSFLVGNRVNVNAANQAFDTNIADNFLLTAVTATTITYDAPDSLVGTGQTAGAGTVSRSVALPFTRNAMFCANGRSYMIYMTDNGGLAEKLMCMDITDANDTFEAPLFLDLPRDENSVDSRALAERKELHIAIHPAKFGAYNDNTQFQAGYMLTVDLDQIDKAMSPAVRLPRIERLSGTELSELEPGYIAGRGIQARGTTPKQLMGKIPIHNELIGQLVYVRLRAQIMNSNAGFRGKVRVCYVIGDDTNDPPLNFLGPTAFSSVGSTDWQHLTTPWVPIVHTALYDGSVPTVADGHVIATFNAVDAERTVIIRAATLELGVRENVTGRIAAYSGTV